MKGFKRVSLIVISILICVFSAVVFAGCNNNDETCKLYVFSTQGGYVLVDDSKDPVEFGDEGSKIFTYNKGGAVKLKAVAETGYVFEKWECTDILDKSVDLTKDSIEFTINDSEVVIRAKFVLSGAITFTVTWDTSTTFSVVPLDECSNQVNLRDDFKFKLVPAEGYSSANAVVKANGTVLTPDLMGEYTISNITKDIKITIGGVSIKSYKVTVDNNTNAIITPESGQTYNVNHFDNFKFKIEVRDDGYNMSTLKVKVGNEVLVADNNGVYTIENITSDIEIVIEGLYKEKYTISYQESNMYTIQADLFTVEHGQSFQFTLEIKDGYKATNLKVSAKVGEQKSQLTANAGVYTIENITSDIEIIVEGVEEDDLGEIGGGETGGENGDGESGNEGESGGEVETERSYTFDVEHNIGSWSWSIIDEITIKFENINTDNVDVFFTYQMPYDFDGTDPIFRSGVNYATFIEDINKMLENEFATYVLDSLSLDSVGEKAFITFGEHSIDVNLDNIPSTGSTVYMNFKHNSERS